MRTLGLVLGLTAASSTFAQTTSVSPAATAPVAASAPAADARHEQRRQSGKMDKNTKVDNPDAALIEYLGEYGDAADGLDPMGLADPEAPVAKSGGGGQ